MLGATKPRNLPTMGPRTRARDPLAPQARPRSRSPIEQFTLVGLNGKKRSYDIVKDYHEDKHGFLTLRGHSSNSKDYYKGLLEGAATLFTSSARDGSKEQYIEERKIKELQGQFSFSRDQSAPHLDTVPGPEKGRYLTQIESVELASGGLAQSPVKQKPEEAHTRLKAEEVSSGVLRDIPPEPKSELQGNESGITQEESNFGLGQVNIFPGEAGEEPRFAQGKIDRINGSKTAQSQVEAVVPSTNFLQELAAVPPDNSTLHTVRQPESRGLKRSRSPGTPSLIPSEPTQSTHWPSLQPSASSRRASPTKPRGSSHKNGTARGRKPAPSTTSEFLSYFGAHRKIVTFNTKNLPRGWLLDPRTMAPVRDPSDVSNKIKDVIQNLYDVQSQTHGFVPETQDLLIDKMAELTQSLADLQRLTDKNLSPNNPVHDIDLAPEIVDYVDDGRNPDIFTRDFVELVQRGNAVVNGKKLAFRDFSVVFAKKLKEGIGGVGRHVDAVMLGAGIEMGEEGEAEGKKNGEGWGRRKADWQYARAGALSGGIWDSTSR